jgi:hypothetical protein
MLDGSVCTNIREAMLHDVVRSLSSWDITREILNEELVRLRNTIEDANIKISYLHEVGNEANGTIDNKLLQAYRLIKMVSNNNSLSLLKQSQTLSARMQQFTKVNPTTLPKRNLVGLTIETGTEVEVIKNTSSHSVAMGTRLTIKTEGKHNGKRTWFTNNNNFYFYDEDLSLVNVECYTEKDLGLLIKGTTTHIDLITAIIHRMETRKDITYFTFQEIKAMDIILLANSIPVNYYDKVNAIVSIIKEK